MKILIRNGRVPTPGIGIMAADETLATELGTTGVIVADVVPFERRGRAMGIVMTAFSVSPWATFNATFRARFPMVRSS